MNPPCPLKIEQERHCRERQLGAWRRTKRGKINMRFMTCEHCAHWLSDDEYYEQQGREHKYSWEERSIDRFAANL